jgi:hypothetical protein
MMKVQEQLVLSALSRILFSKKRTQPKLTI